uniref:Secreted protein n=1 Tax=Ixodes ricinus TaxID=34613 RepID=A0A6B0UFX6_IXORI
MPGYTKPISVLLRALLFFSSGESCRRVLFLFLWHEGRCKFEGTRDVAKRNVFSPREVDDGSSGGAGLCFAFVFFFFFFFLVSVGGGNLGACQQLLFSLARPQ